MYGSEKPFGIRDPMCFACLVAVQGHRYTSRDEVGVIFAWAVEEFPDKAVGWWRGSIHGLSTLRVAAGEIGNWMGSQAGWFQFLHLRGSPALWEPGFLILVSPSFFRSPPKVSHLTISFPPFRRLPDAVLEPWSTFPTQPQPRLPQEGRTHKKHAFCILTSRLAGHKPGSLSGTEWGWHCASGYLLLAVSLAGEASWLGRTWFFRVSWGWPHTLPYPDFLIKFSYCKLNLDSDVFVLWE